MKRYYMDSDYFTGKQIVREHPEGDWVTWEDHLNAVEALTARFMATIDGIVSLAVELESKQD